jgi:hypothetical protein
LNPKINPQKVFIPKIYGFKVFGKKGSKYHDIVKKIKKQMNEKGNSNETVETKNGEKCNIEDFVKKFKQLNIS